MRPHDEYGRSEIVFPHANVDWPNVKGLGGEEASRQLLLRCLDASSPPKPCEPANITARKGFSK